MKPLKSDGQGRLDLDTKGSTLQDEPRDEGAVTPSYGPWREDIIRLLNDALATELVCVLRYKRHYFTAKGRPRRRSPRSSSCTRSRKTAHADRSPSASCSSAASPISTPTTLLRRSHAEYDDVDDLQAMIRANLIAERVAIESVPPDDR